MTLVLVNAKDKQRVNRPLPVYVNCTEILEVKQDPNTSETVVRLSDGTSYFTSETVTSLYDRIVQTCQLPRDAPMGPNVSITETVTATAGPNTTTSTAGYLYMPAGTVGSDASALIYMTSGAGLTEVSCTVSLKTIGVVTTLGTFTATTDSNGYVFVSAPYVSSSDPTGSWIEVEISATSTATDDVTATLEGLYITYE